MDFIWNRLAAVDLHAWLRPVSSHRFTAWLYTGADALIALAYFAFTAAVIFFLRRRRDLRHRAAFEIFGACLFLSGLIHAVHLWAPWHQIYGVELLVKMLTAVSAAVSAVLLFRRLPDALALPSVDEYERALNETDLQTRKKLQAEENAARLEQQLKAASLESQRTVEEARQKLAEETGHRRILENRLRETEGFYRALHENGFDIVILAERDGLIRRDSPSVERWLGYRPEELTGRLIFDFIHDDDRPRARKAYFELLNGREKDGWLEFRVLHRDGTWKTLEISARLMPEDSPVPGVILNARDVTEHRQMETEIRQLPAAMQELNAAEDLHETLEIAVRKVCEMIGWDYGEAWIPQDHKDVLECGPVWYTEESFDEFRRVSRQLRFPPQMGLPGRTWSFRKALWISDVAAAADGTLLSVPVMRRTGVKSALSVPVIVRGKVLAVLVFLARRPRLATRHLKNLVSLISSQVGNVIDKKIAEQSFEEAQEKTEQRIREKTDGLLRYNETLQGEINELKLREEILRSSQENFSTLVNSIEGIVWEYDLRASRFTFVSEQAKRILGYPAEAWFAEAGFWQDHIHGGDRSQALAFRAKVADEKKGDECEYRMISVDGQTIWLRDMVTPVVEDGQTIKLRGVMVNITESKEVEEALNQERNFVSAVLDTASALVMILDTEGRVVRFNRACEQTSGYSYEEVKGRFFWDLFSSVDEIGKIKMIFARLLAGQFPTNHESSWVAKDGSQRVIAWSNTVLLNRYGAVVHVITTGVDITKRKEVEQKLKEVIADLARSNKELDKSSRELQEANQQLRRLDEMKSYFISAASHELRTPLTSIKGYVESVIEDEVGPLNDKQREFLGYVKEATERLHRLLNQLLDISKIESGQVRMQKELTNLRDLLKEEFRIFKAHADKRDISLRLECDIHLREIYCDADKIREVMDNLISNAIKYTPRGGRVLISAKNLDTGVQIHVKDTGIGIRQEDQARIFEPFQCLAKEGIEDPEESTGLGLTLVKRIVEVHDGEIQVSSQEGKGSTFTVILPLGERSEKETVLIGE